MKNISCNNGELSKNLRMSKYSSFFNYCRFQTQAHELAVKSPLVAGIFMAILWKFKHARYFCRFVCNLQSKLSGGTGGKMLVRTFNLKLRRITRTFSSRQKKRKIPSDTRKPKADFLWQCLVSPSTVDPPLPAAPAFNRPLIKPQCESCQLKWSDAEHRGKTWLALAISREIKGSPVIPYYLYPAWEPGAPVCLC